MIVRSVRVELRPELFKFVFAQEPLDREMRRFSRVEKSPLVSVLDRLLLIENGLIVFETLNQSGSSLPLPWTEWVFSLPWTE